MEITDEAVNTASTAVENQTAAGATSTVDLSTLTADQLLAMEEAELAEAKAAFGSLKKEAADVGKVFTAYARAKIKAEIMVGVSYLWNHKNTIALWAAIVALLAKTFGLL